jgi:ABC-type multidrug transport system ATPase subunit
VNAVDEIRLLLGKTLSHDPEILIVDEPASGLSVVPWQRENDFMSLVLDFNQNQ